ncbi:MAG: helix-turn-helix domain-containing protein [Acidobacteriota bacterium]
MSTPRIRLTMVQRALVQAQSPAFTVTELLDLYLATPGKQREEQFVSTARAAEIAGLSQRTIQVWIDSGALPAIRIGKNYRVRRVSLHQYLQEPNT